MLIHVTTWMTPEDKPVTKGYMLYDLLYIKCPEQTNP